MSRLQIRPLCVGHFGGPLRPSRDGVPQFTSAMFMFLVTGGPELIVVDTGTLDETAAAVRQHRILCRPPELHPLAALGQAGVSPADVTIVVNTHLHWDHCANNPIFPRARVLVQSAEITYAADPMEAHRPFYDKLPGIMPPWLDSWDQIEVVDGDCGLLPGVSLVWLPGHSPGSQGVLVHTAAGPYLIAGDTVNLYRDLDDGQGQPRPPSLLTSLEDWRSSMRRIESLHCTVIPSHDRALLARSSFG